MRHLGIVASSAPQASAPTITINSTTNFNQNRATFNATVNPNGATTSVKFQYSTDQSTWTDSGTVSGLTGASQSVYFNHSSPSLSVGTLYYVRAIATNSVGSVTSSNTTFTTWSLKFYRNGASGSPDTASGSTTFTVPTVTPTGSSAVIPTVNNLLVVGGGGGWDNQTLLAARSGGGGGGKVFSSSVTFSDASTTTLTIAIGAGGGQNTDGGNTSVSASNFTERKGTGGNRPFSDNDNLIYRGGASGTGDNVANNGGSDAATYNAKGPEYAYGGGGGGGVNGTGGAGSTSGGVNATGGTGGAGLQYSGLSTFNYGAGGRGGAEAYSSATQGTAGANSAAVSGVGPYGKGGDAAVGATTSGTIGLVYFEYYAS